jgi:hypothetical protein
MSDTRLGSDEHSFAESVEDRQELLDDKPSRHTKRRANVYDAVAGRVAYLVIKQNQI